MTTSNLISGIFVDRNAGDLEREVVDVSNEDFAAFRAGDYSHLTSRQVTYIRELEDDPNGTKWNAAHANYIYVAEDKFFEFLWVYFPAWEPWEKNYQDLRKMIGEKPIDNADLLMVAMRMREGREA